MKKSIIAIVGLFILLFLVGCSLQKTPTTINNIANTTSPDDLALITQALAEKSEWPAEQTTVTVLQNTGDHARGGVIFQDKNGQGGGYWFAVKELDKWRIVLDGNGSIPCAQMKNEGFPDAMIPDCAN